MSASQASTLPRALVVVTALFFAYGTAAVIEMIVASSRGSYSTNYGAAGLLVGFGLLMRSPWARLLALVMTSLVAVLLLVFAAMAINGVPATLAWFGETAPIAVPGWQVVALGAFILAIAAWQLEVLMRPEVVKLFQ